MGTVTPLNLCVISVEVSPTLFIEYFSGRIHTAVKIALKYSQPTVHVFDASKSVVVVSFK